MKTSKDLTSDIFQQHLHKDIKKPTGNFQLKIVDGINH